MVVKDHYYLPNPSSSISLHMDEDSQSMTFGTCSTLRAPPSSCTPRGHAATPNPVKASDHETCWSTGTFEVFGNIQNFGHVKYQLISWVRGGFSGWFRDFDSDQTMPIVDLDVPRPWHSGSSRSTRHFLTPSVDSEPWWPVTRNLPSGKQTKNYGKSPFLMGKLTINGHVQ